MLAHDRNLENRGLEGPMPNLIGLDSLKVLRLGHNKISGNFSAFLELININTLYAFPLRWPL